MQVSVDFAWSPNGIDGRWFDWKGLAAAAGAPGMAQALWAGTTACYEVLSSLDTLIADLLFVMGYDTQSQIWGECKANANSPLALVESGLQQYLALGIPASKLVLGVPW